MAKQTLHKMTHTVGLLGSNGRVGGAVLPHLLEAHQKGHIKLILLFRSSSEPKSSIDTTVEIRKVDFEHAGPTDFDAAVKGIQVFLSAIGVFGLQHQMPIVEALGRSSDIITFIPSRFGAVWGPDTFKDSLQREQMEGMINAPGAHAMELGVGVTKVNAGLFDEYAFVHKLAGMDVKANSIQANATQLANPFPITYLGHALADLLTRPPSEIANQTYSYIEFWPTGSELVQILSKLHGTPTKVLNYTEEDEVALRKQVPMGPTSAAYRSAWAKGAGAFGYVNEHPSAEKGLEDVIKGYLI